MKFTNKRLLSLLLCLALVLAMLPLSIFAETSTVTVYFQNNWKWTDVRVHYWGDEGTSWPGMPMTYVETDADGNDIYSAEIPAGVAGFLFDGIKNDGSGALDQSPNITTIETGVCYYMTWNNGNQVGTFEYGTSTEPTTEPTDPPAPTYIVAGNSADVFGTAWDPANTANQMSDEDGDGVYTITYANVPAGDYLFKVTDGSWANAWGGSADSDGNYGLNVAVAGSELIIYFNSNDKTVSATVNAPEIEDITIYADANALGYAPIYVYCWNESTDENNGWPGVEMTLVEGSIYSAEIAGDSTNVIFNNNNGNQTVNLVPADGCVWNGVEFADYATYTPVTYHVVGSMNEWSAADSDAMTANGDFTFSVSMVLPADNYEYKVWSSTSNWYPAGVDNLTLSLQAKCLVTFTFDLTTGTTTTTYEIVSCDHPSHDQDGKCTVCSEIVAHTYENGSCTVCRKACEHSWADGTCGTCGMACSHDWNSNGVCGICGAGCDHEWEDGECTLCGTVCGHDWNNGKCSTCGTVCGHDSHSKDGKCTVCGKSVEHSYRSVVTEPTCTEGGYTTYTCTVCGDSYEGDKTSATGHNWNNGVCGTCGEVCEHSYVGGSCTICGETEPTITVYYDNTVNAWSEPYVYYFVQGAGGPVQWPGVPMTPVAGETDLYTHEVPASCTHVIFTNNSNNQTADLAVPTGSNNTWNGFEWVAEGTEFSFYVTGDPVGSWEPNAAVMTEVSDGIYQLALNNVTAGTYAFKVTIGSWDDGKNWGDNGGNYSFTLDAIRNVTITFNAATKEISVDAVPVTVTGSDAIKWQISNGASETDATTKLRLVTWVDSLEYQSVKFTIQLAGKTAEYECTTVYEQLVAGSTTYTSAADVFGEDAAYFVTVTIPDFPVKYYNTEVSVTVTWTDLDGNVRTSEARTFVVADAM